MTGKTSADAASAVSVFLKLSEEAKCEVVGGCLFTYVDPDAALTAATVTWDDTLDYYSINIVGQTAEGRLFLDGLEQTTKLGDNKEKFIVTSIATSTVASVVYMDSKGTIAPTENAKLSIVVPPMLTKVEPTVGSFGGT